MASWIAWCSALLPVTTWSLLFIGTAAVPAAEDAKPVLRGMSWDAIKQMPDWSSHDEPPVAWRHRRL